jgi:transposase
MHRGPPCELVDGITTTKLPGGLRFVSLRSLSRQGFLWSADAAPRAAVLFTILAGAKRHRLEPWAYLRDVLLQLSAGETDLEPLLPDGWDANHPEHVLQHRLDESRRKATRQKERRQRRRALAAKKASEPATE